MERGKSKDPGKQERLDGYKAQFKDGKGVVWPSCRVEEKE